MASSSYSARTGLKSADRGARRVAASFGRAALLTHSAKAAGLHAVEGHPERLVSNLLGLDPRVARYEPQPMTVDIEGGRLLRSAEDRRIARARHKELGTAAVLYTPDFGTAWLERPQCVLEVKSDEYPGDFEYDQKLEGAKAVLNAHGFEFMKVVMPSDPLHPLHVNVPLLHQAALRSDLQPTTVIREQVEELEERGASTLGEYCRGLGMDMRMASVLITWGVLSVAVTKHPLRANTPARPAHGSLDHLCVLEEFVA